MSRVQLALNVSDLEAAIDFYSRLFSAVPAKRRLGYANFAIEEPPLKLVLIEDPEGHAAGTGAALNHLGVEVMSRAEVVAVAAHLEAEGLATNREEGICCYALQDKVWVTDPDGLPWETYVVLDQEPGADGELADGELADGELADGELADRETTGCCTLTDELHPQPACC